MALQSSCSLQLYSSGGRLRDGPCRRQRSCCVEVLTGREQQAAAAEPNFATGVPSLLMCTAVILHCCLHLIGQCSPLPLQRSSSRAVPSSRRRPLRTISPPAMQISRTS